MSLASKYLPHGDGNEVSKPIEKYVRKPKEFDKSEAELPMESSKFRTIQVCIYNMQPPATLLQRQYYISQWQSTLHSIIQAHPWENTEVNLL